MDFESPIETRQQYKDGICELKMKHTIDISADRYFKIIWDFKNCNQKSLIKSGYRFIILKNKSIAKNRKIRLKGRLAFTSDQNTEYLDNLEVQ